MAPVPPAPVAMRFRYAAWDAERHGTTRSTFDTLLDLFQQLLLHTGGDADEALQWLTAIDREYGVTDDEMGLGDFIEELKNQGYIARDDETGVVAITAITVTKTARLGLFPYRDEIKSAMEVTRWARPIRTSFLSSHHQPTKTKVGPK